MSERIKNILINGAVIIALCLLLFAAATWWRMASQYELGESAFLKGDFPGAVAGYESAIHMYVPFHPTIDRAAQRLWSIGELNEQQGDIARALIAYRALRSSFYADRWLMTPGQEWIDRCDRRIAALVPLHRER